MKWLANRMSRRYLQGLADGYRDCARLLMSRGSITVHEFAAILQACEKVDVSTETGGTLCG